MKLADKIWDMTGFAKFDPAKGSKVSRDYCPAVQFHDQPQRRHAQPLIITSRPLQRVKHFQSVRQQTSIERVHGMALLHNEQGLCLDEVDESLLNEVGIALMQDLFYSSDFRR
jgi:hypothetical protein